jgi:hypothetical protein
MGKFHRIAVNYINTVSFYSSSNNISIALLANESKFSFCRMNAYRPETVYQMLIQPALGSKIAAKRDPGK